MPPDRRDMFLHQIFDEAFNHGNMSVVDELFSLEHLAHITLDGVRGHSNQLKWQVSKLRIGFPDLYCAVEAEIQESGRIAACWTLQGTHKGLFMGNPPTGKKVKSQGSLFISIAGGSITEYWLLIDRFGMLQQLGLIPR